MKIAKKDLLALLKEKGVGATASHLNLSRPAFSDLCKKNDIDLSPFRKKTGRKPKITIID